MAIIRSNGVGKARGSVDNWTYTTIEGRTIARAKPAFVDNPNTEKQQAQRAKMRNIVFLWRHAGQRLEKLWTKRKKYNSPYNAFVSANIMRPETFEVDLKFNTYSLEEGFILGEGQYSNLELSEEIGVRMVTVKIAKNTSLYSNVKVGDVVGVVVLGDSMQIVEVVEWTVTEDDLWEGKHDIDIELAWLSDDAQGYATYWYSPLRKLSTDCIALEMPKP